MDSDSLITYPSDFPIKIMGPSQPQFIETIVALVQRHAPDFDPGTLECRESSAGNYMAITCTIRATSRKQLDNLYRELSAHPMVKVVL
ncbi:MAG: YbeD family protein [Burkholderiales bacterium]